MGELTRYDSRNGKKDPSALTLFDRYQLPHLCYSKRRVSVDATVTRTACYGARYAAANLYAAPDSDRASNATRRTSQTSDNTVEGLGWDRTEPAPSIQEIEMALESLKPDKAVEPDGIPSEMLKLGGETVTKALHRIIETV